MAAIPYHVADAFLQGKHARAGNFYSTGKSIFSYGLELAHWGEDCIILDYDLNPGNAPSVTTARHISALREELRALFPDLTFHRGDVVERYR